MFVDGIFCIAIGTKQYNYSFSYVAHFVQTLVQSWEGYKLPAETGQAFPYIHVNDSELNKTKKSIMLMSELDM